MKLKKIRGKKGYFFSVDAIAAAAILITGIFLIFYITSNKPVETPTYHLSEDILNVLEKTQINNLSKKDYPYISVLIEGGEIVRTDNTILEQVGEFYYEGKHQIASELIKDIVSGLLPSQHGFSFKIYDSVIGDKDGKVLYKMDDGPIREEDANVRIALRKIIFGRIDVDKKWGPYVVEAISWR